MDAGSIVTREPTLDDIRDAARIIEGRVVRTPTMRSIALSQLTGANVYLKLDNLQHTGAFKTRGACVKLMSLTEAQRKAGVIAASAGNHAQGVAHHAHELDIPAIIVMPKATPFTKIARTEAFGAKVVLHGEGFWESRDHAMELAESEGYTFIHPYDDTCVIAGQGTVGLEMMEDVPELDAIIVPIGGGGLISGVAIAAKGLKPGIEIYGAQSSYYPSMQAHLKGLALPTQSIQTLADGIAVKTPGDLTRGICEKLVTDVFDADENDIEQAILHLHEKQRLVAEGAGAVGLATLINHADQFRGKSVGLVISGGNIDARILSSVLMRGLVREGRLVRLRLKITDVPGVLAKVSAIIGDAGANIIEVHHQRLIFDAPIRETELDVAMETMDIKHVESIIAKLKAAGFEARKLSGSTESND